MVALLASIAVMLVLMAAATPGWRYVMKDMREEELIFRGGQVADAILRFQRKNGNALPVSIEQLVKGKFLRKAFVDPMTRDGKWRFIRPGELIAPSRPPGAPGSGLGGIVPQPTPAPTIGGAGTIIGPFIGVASTSKDKSLRVFNGKERYNEWLFVAGQPRFVGAMPGPLTPGMPGRPPGGPGGQPGMPNPYPGGQPPGSGPFGPSR
jgi:type II secretory pathway pseudopilin PulG